MCGRFAQVEPPPQLAWMLGVEADRVDPDPPGRPRYNVAPGSPALVVWADGGGRRASFWRWGFVPSWALPGRWSRPPLVNARVETAPSLPAFRQAARLRRALVPVTGFYEWGGDGPRRRPYFLRAAGGEPLALGALWEERPLPAGGREPCFAILTTRASGDVEPLHSRMPVVVPPAWWDRWLTPAPDAEVWERVASPLPRGSLQVYPVTDMVNRPTYDDPACLVPADRGDTGI
jgi:putative SOS response-associated peptidase YedK